MMSRCFPALFGLLAVVVRRLPGWPIWFAVLWAAQEWLKSIFPFGGFPWGSVAFGQTNGPLLPLVQLGGVALLSAAVVLLGCSFTAIALEIVAWWPVGQPPRDRDGPETAHRATSRHRRWCSRASASVWCCSPPSWSGRRCGTPARGRVATRSSPSPSCRATCPGWASTSTRNVARCWTTTSARRCGWPRTCGPGPPRNPSSSSGRRTRRTSIRSINPDAGRADREGGGGDRRADPGRHGARRPVPRRRTQATDTPEYTNTMIVWNPGHRPG